MSISKRIESIIKHYNVSIRSFEKSIEASNNSINTTIKRGADVKSNTINKILQVYTDINPEWLLTGNGEMLKNDAEKVPQNTNQQATVTVKPASVMSDTGNKIPLMYQDAVAGFGNSEFAINEQDVKEYYTIPKFKHTKVDFMIEVRGNSMYPKYNSGDVVACCIINDSTFIQWNKPHIVATKEQDILIKRILEGNRSDTLTLKSDNKDYPPFDVPKEQIDGIAIVVGVIRLE